MMKLRIKQLLFFPVLRSLLIHSLNHNNPIIFIFFIVTEHSGHPGQGKKAHHKQKSSPKAGLLFLSRLLPHIYKFALKEIKEVRRNKTTTLRCYNLSPLLVFQKAARRRCVPACRQRQVVNSSAA